MIPKRLPLNHCCYIKHRVPKCATVGWCFLATLAIQYPCLGVAGVLLITGEKKTSPSFLPSVQDQLHSLRLPVMNSYDNVTSQTLRQTNVLRTKSC